MVRKLICGVGLNDADYVTQINEYSYKNGKRKQKKVWTCPFYRKWTDMINRGYSIKLKLKHPTYKECSVCEEWLIFSNFKAWMEKQDWEDKHLDKDLLSRGNKVYSPDKCCFISKEINTFLLESDGSRGLFPIGVQKTNTEGKFRADCRNPFTKSGEYIGRYNSVAAAYNAWWERKLQWAYLLAEKETDPLIANALVEYYLNYKQDKQYQPINYGGN
jgi:hypothetical protein